MREYDRNSRVNMNASLYDWDSDGSGGREIFTEVPRTSKSKNLPTLRELRQRTSPVGFTPDYLEEDCMATAEDIKKELAFQKKRVRSLPFKIASKLKFK